MDQLRVVERWFEFGCCWSDIFFNFDVCFFLKGIGIINGIFVAGSFGHMDVWPSAAL